VKINVGFVIIPMLFFIVIHENMLGEHFGNFENPLGS
jgi:hypothetical protein